MVQRSFGQKAGNSIVPYKSKIKQTKTIDFKSYVTATGWTVDNCDVILFADSNDEWWMTFTGSATKDSGTATTVTFLWANLVWAYEQSITAQPLETSVTYPEAKLANINGTNEMNISSLSQFDKVFFSETIKLASEPTTYTTAANLESHGADQHIEEATSENAGLVGGSNGVAVPAGQIGEVIFSGVSAPNCTNGQFNNIESVSLDTGVWLIIGNATLADAGSCTRIDIAISEYSGNTTTDHTNGDNLVSDSPYSFTNALPVPQWTVAVTTSTTVYLKAYPWVQDKGITGSIRAIRIG